ncbi:MAG: divalent-cation tolerance protein CutA [Planctomycetia bacterium]|nr:divalent-cation tolerance protein CutA [Planctomycetia bacterium]
MAEFIQVATTIDSREAADKLAAHLVELRLAACVQVTGPIASTYRWQGKIEAAQEWLVVAKTRQDLYSRVESAIRQRHTYQVPEILATAVVAGSADYLRWLRSETP